MPLGETKKKTIEQPYPAEYNAGFNIFASYQGIKDLLGENVDYMKVIPTVTDKARFFVKSIGVTLKQINDKLEKGLSMNDNKKEIKTWPKVGLSDSTSKEIGEIQLKAVIDAKQYISQAITGVIEMAKGLTPQKDLSDAMSLLAGGLKRITNVYPSLSTAITNMSPQSYSKNFSKVEEVLPKENLTSAALPSLTQADLLSGLYHTAHYMKEFNEESKSKGGLGVKVLSAINKNVGDVFTQAQQGIRFMPKILPNMKTTLEYVAENIYEPMKDVHPKVSLNSLIRDKGTFYAADKFASNYAAFVGPLDKIIPITKEGTLKDVASNLLKKPSTPVITWGNSIVPFATSAGWITDPEKAKEDFTKEHSNWKFNDPLQEEDTEQLGNIEYDARKYSVNPNFVHTSNIKAPNPYYPIRSAMTSEMPSSSTLPSSSSSSKSSTTITPTLSATIQEHISSAINANTPSNTLHAPLISSSNAEKMNTSSANTSNYSPPTFSSSSLSSSSSPHVPPPPLVDSSIKTSSTSPSRSFLPQPASFSSSIESAVASAMSTNIKENPFVAQTGDRLIRFTGKMPDGSPFTREVNGFREAEGYAIVKDENSYYKLRPVNKDIKMQSHDNELLNTYGITNPIIKTDDENKNDFSQLGPLVKDGKIYHPAQIGLFQEQFKGFGDPSYIKNTPARKNINTSNVSREKENVSTSSTSSLSPSSSSISQSNFKSYENNIQYEIPSEIPSVKDIEMEYIIPGSVKYPLTYDTFSSSSSSFDNVTGEASSGRSRSGTLYNSSSDSSSSSSTPSIPSRIFSKFKSVFGSIFAPKNPSYTSYQKAQGKLFVANNIFNTSFLPSSSSSSSSSGRSSSSSLPSSQSSISGSPFASSSSNENIPIVLPSSVEEPQSESLIKKGASALAKKLMPENTMASMMAMQMMQSQAMYAQQKEDQDKQNETQNQFSRNSLALQIMEARRRSGLG
jgi:hypothetical protein